MATGEPDPPFLRLTRMGSRLAAAGPLPAAHRDTRPLTNAADLRAASDLVITGGTVWPLSLKPSGPSTIIDRERRINVSRLFVGIGAGG
jgi:hypothetical protein